MYLKRSSQYVFSPKTRVKWNFLAEQLPCSPECAY